MAAYQIPVEFDVKEYPFELRNQVSRFLNTHMGKFTIPQIAAELKADENQVAWVLSNLVELTTPDVIADTIKGNSYWDNAAKLKAKSPKSFEKDTIFFGKIMK